MTLTPPERALLGEIVAGKTYREVGAALGKTENTIRQQAYALRHKVGARNNAALARLWVALYGKDA